MVGKKKDEKFYGEGSVEFPCPKCGDKIMRTYEERRLGTKYVCKKCSFEGPN